MKLLLDTHIMLWAMTDDERLSDKARELIDNEENEVFFSIISLWEIQIKHILHPDKIDNAQTVAGFCSVSGFEMLDLSDEAVYLLPGLTRPDTAPRHKDPFDKMLICQAVCEDMSFLTHDSLLSDYGIKNVMIV